MNISENCTSERSRLFNFLTSKLSLASTVLSNSVSTFSKANDRDYIFFKYQHALDDDTYGLKRIRALLIFNDGANDYILSLPPDQRLITVVGSNLQNRRVCDISDCMLADF